MSAAAFELSTSLHDDECGCDDEVDYRGWEASMRRSHPLVWDWAKDKHPTNDSSYIDARNRLGRNPKREPNPDAMPRSSQRRLTKSERLLLKRRQSRWRWADRRTYDDDDDSLVECYVYGRRMTLAQAVKFIEIVDEIPNVKSTDDFPQ